MKKSLIALVMLLLAALCMCQMASADSCESEICQLAMQNDKIVEAKCIVYQRCCLIAVKTEKFATKSEYDQFVKNLTAEITDKFEIDHVFVSRNPKIMREVNRLAELDGQERDEAIQNLIEKEILRSKHHRNIAPRLTGLFDTTLRACGANGK